MTQAELGQRLNYSDKSISKWERGEAIPDAFVLTQMAELFGVTVDYLLSSHDAWEKPKDEDEEDQKPFGAGYGSSEGKSDAPASTDGGEKKN